MEELIRRRPRATTNQFERYRDDPVGFARDILGVSLWEKQQQIALSVVNNRRTTVRSCHNSGKTFVAACLTLWFVYCFEPSLVITTATTDRQVKKQLWGEIRRLQLSASLSGTLRMQELMLSATQQALGFTTSEAEKFQGWHSPHILIIVDEASGVEEPIFAAIEGCLTGPDPRLLLIGNPNNAVGTFFESFRSELYSEGRFHLQASDVPEWLLPASWAEERRLEWGEDSPLYQVRVLGEFPEQGEDSLISLKWAEDAQEREIEPTGTVEIGLDVARFGSDESVACVRRGSCVVGLESWRGADTQASAGRTLHLARRVGADTIRVDDIGVGGGVTDRMVDESRGAALRVQGVNVGEKARDDEKFYNRRSELFWGLRERFKSGDISIPKDDVLLSQLTALRYSYTPRGQIKVESKDDLKKRRPQGAKWTSPDRADALMLAFAQGGPKWLPVSLYGGSRETPRPVFYEAERQGAVDE